MASSVRQAHTRFTAGKAPRRQRTLKHESHEKGRNPRNTRHPLSCPSLPFVSFVIQTSLHNRDLLLHQPTQLNRQHVSLRASTESLSPLKPLRSLKPLQCDHSSQCISGSTPPPLRSPPPSAHGTSGTPRARPATGTAAQSHAARVG